MNDAQLDALLSRPLPELDTTHFSVAVMEAIARDAARPARVLGWIMVGVLAVVVALACVFGATLAGRDAMAGAPIAIPLALSTLVALLCLSVLQAARE